VKFGFEFVRKGIYTSKTCRIKVPAVHSSSIDAMRSGVREDLLNTKSPLPG
jgi:hypothetical protein